MYEMKTHGIDLMKIDCYYFPANTKQFEDLVGKMLTQVEAMNLRESVEKANKDIVRQILWNWWSGVQENSLTSSGRCIGPILAPNSDGRVSDIPHYWLTDIGQIKKLTGDASSDQNK